MTQETTSPERQEEIITAAACARGSEIIGWARDLDVSASKVHPMERPELAEWLARPDEFDEIIFWRLDRLIRKVSDFADMIKWAEKYGKGLRSATEPIDLRSQFGKLIAYIVAVFAEIESMNTSERVSGAHAYLRSVGRWGGGWAPYGYQAVPNPDGNGYVLVIDHEAAEVIREAVRRVIAGEAVNAVVADFNRRDVLTPQDHVHQRAGRPVQGKPWSAQALMSILRSQTLLGYVTYKSDAVRGPNGTPIVRTTPLISETEWDQLQHELDSSARQRSRRRTQTPSLLLGVVKCAICGANCYLGPSARGEMYYRCRTHSRAAQHKVQCPALQLRLDSLNALAEALFVAQVGDVEVLERVYRPGVDHADEIALLRRSISSVRAEFDGGGYSYPGGEEEYLERIERLSGRLRELADQPVTQAGYDYRPTGQTFRQKWEASTIPERRALMLSAGFQLRVSRTRAKPTPRAKRAGVRDVLQRQFADILRDAGADITRWDEIRRLVGPITDLALSWQLDEDLARRAGLAASGIAVPQVPDNEAWERMLRPLREQMGRPPLSVVDP